MVRPAVAAIVLAAGRASRFGGPKLLADLGGRPLLAWVLDALAAAGLDDPIVVVPPDAAALRAAIQGADGPHASARPAWITNPEPADGLSSSLRIGWAAARDARPEAGAIVVALGDQPLVGARVFGALAEARLDRARPIVAVRRSGSSAPNPVRLEVSAEALVAESAGDRGLGPILERHPRLVRWIDAPGDNPDVDTPGDLARVRRALPTAPEPPAD